MAYRSSICFNRIGALRFANAPDISASSENQQLLDKIANLEEDNRKLEATLDQILPYLQQPK